MHSVETVGRNDLAIRLSINSSELVSSHPSVEVVLQQASNQIEGKKRRLFLSTKAVSIFMIATENHSLYLRYFTTELANLLTWN